MKKNLLFLALALVALSASAQQSQAEETQPAAVAAQPAWRFGYFSFEQVFHTMPGYAIAKHNMDEQALDLTIISIRVAVVLLFFRCFQLCY